MSKIRQIREILGVEPADYWGPVAQQALDELIHLVQGVLPVTDVLDRQSEQNISTLEKPVQDLARALVRQAAATGIKIKVTSGTRTYEEQHQLFLKGGVTKADAGHSNHNFGLAFDVTVFNGEVPKWDGPEYRKVGQLGKDLGLSWGGDWTSFSDEPHFELRPKWAAQLPESAMLSELRARKAVNKNLWV